MKKTSSFIPLLFFISLSCAVQAQQKKNTRNINLPASSALCWYTPTNDSFAYGYLGLNILDYHVDAFGNSYVSGCMMGGFYGWSPAWYMVLEKFDRNGNLKWRKFHDAQNIYNPNDKYRSLFCTGITSDNSGNIYVTGNYGCSKLIWDSIYFVNANNNSKGFIAKLDSNGIAQWGIKFDTPNGNGSITIGGSDIQYANDNQIFVCINGSGMLYFTDGTTKSFSDDFSILEINKDGLFKKITGTSSTSYPGSGPQTYFNPDPSSWYSNEIATVSPKIYIGKRTRKLYVVGKFMYKLQIVSPSIYVDSISGGVNGFVAVMDTVSGWQNAFVTHGSNDDYYMGSGQTRPDIFPSFAVDTNENIYIADRWDSIPWKPAFTMEIIQGQPLPGIRGSFIAKYDKWGNLKWYNHNSTCFTRSLAYSASGNILMYGEFNDSLRTVSQSVAPISIFTNGQRDLFLGSVSASGDMNWLSDLGSTGMDYSSFMKSHPCSDNMYFMGRLADTCTFAGNQLNNAGNRIFASKFSYQGNCTDTACVSTTGIHDYSGSDVHFSVYPNPCTDKITLEFSGNKINRKLNLEIRNIFGQNLFFSDAIYPDSPSSIDMTSFPSGIYFIRVHSDSFSVSKKVVKE